MPFGSISPSKKEILLSVKDELQKLRKEIAELKELASRNAETAAELGKLLKAHLGHSSVTFKVAALSGSSHAGPVPSDTDKPDNDKDAESKPGAPPPRDLKLLHPVTGELVHGPVKSEELNLEGMRQFYLGVVEEDWKLDALCQLFEALDINKTSCIVSLTSRRKVEWLTEILREEGYSVSVLYHGKDTRSRDSAMRRFRGGSARVLLTTSALLAYRNVIHVQKVPLVVLYDLPSKHEDYHFSLERLQSGGIAISFVTKEEETLLSETEKFYETAIQELPADVAKLLWSPAQLQEFQLEEAVDVPQ